MRSSVNIEQVRNDTPACQQILHFNNAGASLSPSPVLTAIKYHLDLESQIGGYEAEKAAFHKTSAFYEVAAQLIHASSDEIAFMENATRAWEMAFYSFKFKAGDKIVTCVAEYASNYLAFLQQAKYNGVEIEVIQNDAYGQLDLNDLQQKINPRVKLIAITHVPTQGGLINPAVEVGKIANAFNIPYLLDATQSIGQIPIDVNVLGCDFLCATGRKYLRGPRGTGFLYAKKSILSDYHPPFIDLHSAKWVADDDYILQDNAQRFETWEQNIAAKIGLSTAIQYALQLGLPAIWQRIQDLARLLRENLSQIKQLRIQDLGLNQCGIVTFSSLKKSAEQIQQYLTKQKINVSISLQEYARLDLAARKIPALVRASVHYYNTEAEIELFCKHVDKFINR